MDLSFPTLIYVVSQLPHQFLVYNLANMQRKERQKTGRPFQIGVLEYNKQGNLFMRLVLVRNMTDKYDK